jgi:excisionase family DNA binding protein
LPPHSGGGHPKHLQQLTERLAEDHGHEVVVETLVADGLESLAILTKDDSPPIACEISMATAAGHEVADAQTCLAAVYGHVLMIAPDKEALDRVKVAVEAGLHQNQRKLVRVVLPELAFGSAAALAVNATPSTRVADDRNQILTAKEVEELLRIDVKTVYSYVQKGLIPYVKIQSNVRFIRSEILKWIEERQFKPGRAGDSEVNRSGERR